MGVWNNMKLRDLKGMSFTNLKVCVSWTFNKGYDWEDYGREMFELMGYKIEDSILDYFDFKAYGESFQYDGIDEYSEGLIEIRR